MRNFLLSPARVYHFILATGSDSFMTNREDDGVSITLAGIETSARAASVISFWLLKKPEIKARLQAELEAAIPNPDRMPPLAELEKLPYLNAVLQEGKQSKATHFLSRNNDKETQRQKLTPKNNTTRFPPRLRRLQPPEPLQPSHPHHLQRLHSPAGDHFLHDTRPTTPQRERLPLTPHFQPRTLAYTFIILLIILHRKQGRLAAATIEIPRAILQGAPELHRHAPRQRGIGDWHCDVGEKIGG
jgi:hypothetical protein